MIALAEQFEHADPHGVSERLEEIRLHLIERPLQSWHLRATPSIGGGSRGERPTRVIAEFSKQDSAHPTGS
ncbi:hypothetical protein GCM10010198_69830 [Nocardia seriolae]|nr:hypothetical protein NSERKGN1266_52380 [Nocardia seriolae]GEM26594.1 hypothetical protein NS2_48330 [Nocardia seriolae NBRC 15557]